MPSRRAIGRLPHRSRATFAPFRLRDFQPAPVARVPLSARRMAALLLSVNTVKAPIVAQGLSRPGGRGRGLARWRWNHRRPGRRRRRSRWGRWRRSDRGRGPERSLNGRVPATPVRAIRPVLRLRREALLCGAPSPPARWRRQRASPDHPDLGFGKIPAVRSLFRIRPGSGVPRGRNERASGVTRGQNRPTRSAPTPPGTDSRPLVRAAPATLLRNASHLGM
jgi:hypothetical protein